MQVNKWFLLGFFVVFYLLPLNLHPLWMPDETRYAEISREMIETGDWIVPRLLDLRYFEKPVAGYWLNSISQLMFGETNFAARFIPALMTFLSACLVYWLALRMWNNPRKAVLSAVIYLSSFLVFIIGTFNVLDPIITFWLTATMCAFYWAITAQSQKSKLLAYVVIGLCSGLGVLTKGFLALAVPVVAGLPFMLLQKRFTELLQYVIISAFVATLVCLPWALMINAVEADYWHYFFWVEHIKRFMATDAQHKEPVWYFLPILLFGLIPWVGWLPKALQQAWQQRKQHHDKLYLLAWSVMPFLFFSASSGKLPTYILPVFAPLALLLGATVVDSLDANRFGSFRINNVINACVGVFLSVLLLGIGHGYIDSNYRYSAGEEWEVYAALGVFGSWIAINIIQFKWPLKFQQYSWWVNGVIFVPVLLLFIEFLPLALFYSKAPEIFIEENRSLLQSSDILVSDDVGIASGLAWDLKRSDIILFGQSGELHYGLTYPDAKGRLVEISEFSQWLEKQRQSHSVALLTREMIDAELQAVTQPDEMVTKEKYNLFIYRKHQP